ncbi:MAG TPA: hypothetical protein DHV16_11210 [Nitrospiraceae bacterium]|nr:MAG: hypothetical protein A2Z82_07060 [Nitrospirae bacterium GWA2_46_11]HCZ12789.1 hypothetical protein [Nitrospiraceae bacterium]
MSTTQLKNLVIDRIYEIDDDEFLSALKKILDSSAPAGVIYSLNKDQRQAVREGKHQIAAGDFVTNSNLEKEEDKWLNG